MVFRAGLGTCHKLSLPTPIQIKRDQYPTRKKIRLLQHAAACCKNPTMGSPFSAAWQCAHRPGCRLLSMRCAVGWTESAVFKTRGAQSAHCTVCEGAHCAVCMVAQCAVFTVRDVHCAKCKSSSAQNAQCAAGCVAYTVPSTPPYLLGTNTHWLGSTEAGQRQPLGRSHNVVHLVAQHRLQFALQPTLHPGIHCVASR